LGVATFRCRLDGCCCTRFWIPVTHLDLWRLYHYGGFRDLTGLVRFVDADDPDAEPKPILFNGRYVHLALAERGGGCVFLEGGRCRVHSFKPLVCRFYPFVYVVRGDGEVDIEVNERAVSECPGLVLDDRPIDPGIADYLRRVARARIAELKLWSEAAEEWSRDYGRGSDLDELLDYLLRRARGDFVELSQRGMWIR
jgi:Fe-S-cluster containining protein